MSGPFFIASRKPFSQAGMNSRGIDAAGDVVDELEVSTGCSAGSGSM